MNAHDNSTTTHFLAEAPPLPHNLYAAIRSDIHQRGRRRHILFAAAALVAIAIIAPFSLSTYTIKTTNVSSSISVADSSGIDGMLTDAGSLFCDDISHDEEFLAIAIDNLEE